MHSLKKTALFHGERIEAVEQLSRSQVLYCDFDENRVVVPIRECACASEEVEVFHTVLVDDRCALGAREHGRPAPAVVTHVGLKIFEWVHRGFLSDGERSGQAGPLRIY
jgi:hypothetical protein